MQKHSFAHTFCAKIKQGLQKGSASTANPKKEHHHGGAVCLVYWHGYGINCQPSWQPLCNELVEGADEGNNFIL
jgi:hypothetical protein